MLTVLFLVAMAITLWSLPDTESKSNNISLINRVLYALLIALIVFSPLITIYIIDATGHGLIFGRDIVYISLLAGLSLPLILIISRAFGERTYCSFITYLEAKCRLEIRGIAIYWACAFGLLILLLSLVKYI